MCARATRAPARRVEDPEAKGAAGGGGRVEFAGAGPRFAERLAQAVFGGQVVLSEPAWAAIQDQLPGNAQARARGPDGPGGPLEPAARRRPREPVLLAEPISGRGGQPAGHGAAGLEPVEC
jgi:hypothetical protein